MQMKGRGGYGLPLCQLVIQGRSLRATVAVGRLRFCSRGLCGRRYHSLLAQALSLGGPAAPHSTRHVRKLRAPSTRAGTRCVRGISQRPGLSFWPANRLTPVIVRPEGTILLAGAAALRRLVLLRYKQPREGWQDDR